MQDAIVSLMDSIGWIHWGWDREREILGLRLGLGLYLAEAVLWLAGIKDGNLAGSRGVIERRMPNEGTFCQWQWFRLEMVLKSGGMVGPFGPVASHSQRCTELRLDGQPLWDK